MAAAGEVQQNVRRLANHEWVLVFRYIFHNECRDCKWYKVGLCKRMIDQTPVRWMYNESWIQQYETI